MRTSLMFAALVVTLVGAFTFILADGKRPVPRWDNDKPREFQTPEALTLEHQEMQAELALLTIAGPKTAAAASHLSAKLQEHFLSEQQFALPPLGALKKVAAGELVKSPNALIAMTEQLKTGMEQMLSEHQAIKSASDVLAAAGRDEQNDTALRFAEKLRRHAQIEEEVLYPAVIVMGEYLKLKALEPKLPTIPEYREYGRDYMVKK